MCKVEGFPAVFSLYGFINTCDMSDLAINQLLMTYEIIQAGKIISYDWDNGQPAAYRRRVLDLYCGAGGCSWGYYLAGFDPVGVDNKSFRRYPFPQIVANALDVLQDVEFCRGFDLIHASPVCKRYSRITPTKYRDNHNDDIPVLRNLLHRIGRPYVIENVPLSPLKNFLVLDGCMFGLGVKRVRWFECNPVLMFPPVDGGYARSQYRVGGCFSTHKKIGVYGHCFKVEDGRKAMGIDWMTGSELSQAIPPAYTEFIGGEMMRVYAAGCNSLAEIKKMQWTI